jgi:N-acetylglutamate synthase-like GNAT family acetyltransferase
MRAQVLKKRTKAVAVFNDREWPKADTEHYSAVRRWSEEEIRVVGYDGKKIVGSLHLTIKRGVCEINSLIVAKTARGTGVGTMLMQRAEQLARKKHAHKMYLETGKGWIAEPFYKKLGFRKNTILPKHYFKKDFVLYEKVLR